MTKEEAKTLATFEHECTCGGFAWQMSGRPQEQPHMNWCPQYDEYGDWYQALHGGDRREGAYVKAKKHYAS